MFGRIKKFTTVKNWCCYISPISGWFVVGRVKKEFKIVLFLSGVGNRDVCYVACLFAKLVFFGCHLVVDSDVIVVVNGSDEIDPLVVEQALLKCVEAL